MNSRLLEGGTRRRRRRGGGFGARRRGRSAARTVLLTLASLCVIAALGAGGFFLATRPTGRHAPVTAAVFVHGARPQAPSGPKPTVKGIAIGPRRLNVHFGAPPSAGLLFDLDSGRSLWSLHPYARLPVASLTKIMTAILVAERTSSHDLAPVTDEALNYSRQGQALGELPPHKRVPVEGLLAAMLVTSAEDAAIDLADYIGHTDAGFARLMNAKAASLGLRCSHFVSAYGLQPQNQSCPADLGALARIAMAQPRIARYSGDVQARAPFPIKGGYLYVTSTNPLLLSGYPGTIGLKTGYTSEAGQCLVAVVRRGRRTLAAVLLGSPSTASQAEKLFDTAFSHR